MAIWMCNHGLGRNYIRPLLPWLCIGMGGIAVVFVTQPSTPVPVETLDPTLMQAVTASVSHHDVKAVMAYQQSSDPVHLQLYTSCDEEQRCTIYTSMEFPKSESQTSGTTLQVAVHVNVDVSNNTQIIDSTWKIRTVDPAVMALATYAGNFSDLTKVPQIDENNAIARLLTSIRQAVVNVLSGNRTLAKPMNTVFQVPALTRYNCPLIEYQSILSASFPARLHL